MCTCSGSHVKDISELFPLPLVSGTNGLVGVTSNGLVGVTSNGHVGVTPDPSRSCTPISLCAPSPGCSSLGSPGGKGDATPTKGEGEAAQVACQWDDCDNVLECGDLMEHIRGCHVLAQRGREKVVCLWSGCKVYNKPSMSKCWLDRHILTHSGDKPFRCIVDQCGQRFTTQGGLERHVNSHFNSQGQSPNHKHWKHGREDTPTKLLRRKRLKPKRKAAKGRSITVCKMYKIKYIEYRDSFLWFCCTKYCVCSFQIH